MPQINSKDHVSLNPADWAPPLPPTLLERPALQIDLSRDNPDLADVDVADAAAFGAWINAQAAAAGCDWAFGGYAEDRAIYAMSPHFGDSNHGRSVHLGVDFWLPAGTPVFAAADGRVHSFADNSQFGDYGPTIILEHALPSGTLYSLYGHLARSALRRLVQGMPVARGTQIATLGTPDENVGWAPHLHFQLITELGDYAGDFPGVSAPNEASAWLGRCVSPTALLADWLPNWHLDHRQAARPPTP